MFDDTALQEIVCSHAQQRGGFKMISGRNIFYQMCSFFLVTVLAVTLPLPATAQEVHAFNIAAGDSSAAIQAFGAQSGLQIFASAEDLKDKKLNPVVGVFAADAALKNLLAGTGLGRQYVSDRAVALVANVAVSGQTAAADTPSGDGNVKEAVNTDSKLFRVAQVDQGRDANSIPIDEQSKINKAEELDELVVTAQRRPERLQDVPLSVSVLDQAAITELGLTDIEGVTRMTPGLDLTVGAGGQSIVSIRGIVSTFGTATTGIYIDDTPIQVRFVGQGETAGSAYPTLFDLNRIEVLQGPQGTLFGSGSEGGTIRFVTAQPSLSDWSGHTLSEVSFLPNGELGSRFGAAIGGPLIDGTVGFRISAYSEQRGGWIDLDPTGTTGETQKNANSGNTQAINAALTWSVTDALKITPSIYYQRQYQADIGQYWLGPSNPSAGSYINGYLIPEPIIDRFVLPALKLSWDFAAFTVYSNTSFMDRTRDITQDYSFYTTEILTGTSNNPVTLTPAEMRNPQQQFTQEIRAQSADQAARVQWVAGTFFQRVTQSADETVVSPGLNTLTQTLFGGSVAQVLGIGLLPGSIAYEGYDQTVDKQVAAFGQMDVKVTSRWTVTGGARFAHTSFDHANYQNGPFNGGLTAANNSGSENDTTPKAAVNYKPNKNLMWYASIAKGYRPGGTNTPIPTAICAPNLEALGLSGAPDTYGSDHVWSYEVGSKGEAFGSRLQWDTSAFYIRWNQIQSVVSLPACGFEFIKNLGAAVSQGLDAQLRGVVAEGLVVSASLGYTDAKYVRSVQGPTASPIVTDGDRLAAAPWHGALAVDYSISPFSNGAKLYAHADAEYSSSYMTNNPNDALYDPVANIYHASFFSLGRGGLKIKGWDISVFAKNLTNSHSDLFDQHAVLTTPLVTQGSFEPRTIGATVIYEF